MEKTEVRYLEIESRKVEGRKVTGYAAVFNRWSHPLFGYFRERIHPDAFKNTNFTDAVANYNHDDGQILARTSSGTLNVTTDENGLKFEFEMPNTTLGNDLLVLTERGDVAHCSFRFTVKSDKWEKSKLKEIEEDRTLLEIDNVYDVSLVTRPAYPQTSVDIAKRSEQNRQDDKIGDWYYAEMMLGLK